MKKVLIGLVAVSTLAIGAEGEVNTSTPTAQGAPAQMSTGAIAKGTFSNRFGINFGTKGTETWDKDDLSPRLSDTKAFGTSYGLNYKLLYNVTNRFRFGGELAYDKSRLSDDVKKVTKGDTDINQWMLGLTGEYDIYQGQNLAVYLTGTAGAVSGGIEITTNILGATVRKEKLDAGVYVKLGAGMRFNNGLGLEVGSKSTSYDYSLETVGQSKYEDTLYRQQFYLEANYTF